MNNIIHQQVDISNILDLELQIQEKINELQWKTKLLEDSQIELLQLRHELLSKEIILETKERTITDLKMQLTAVSQASELIEKEKTKYMNERIHLQINNDAALRERESLLEQTHAAKLDNISLKLSIQKLTATIEDNKSKKKALQDSLFDTHERFYQIKDCLNSNVAKLEKEHQLLMKSVESTTKLNKRLQTVGLCTYAIYEKKNQEIIKLQKELASKDHVNFLQSNKEIIDNERCEKSEIKTVLEKIRIDIEKDAETDKELEAIIEELENY